MAVINRLNGYCFWCLAGKNDALLVMVTLSIVKSSDSIPKSSDSK